jgi:hypothetical protein
VRCGRSYAHALRWPEGRICRYCYDAARQQQGRCASCGHHGVLPGLTAAGASTCVTCSGIPLDVCCRRCGQEAPMGRSVICWRCQLSDLLDAILSGPDGQIPNHVRPLVAALLGMPRPLSGYAWIRRNPRSQDLLRGLATREVDLDHAALDALPPSRTVEYIRGLLVHHACLPPRDPHLARFESWLTAKLAQVTDPEHRKIVERFARWHLLHRLRHQARAEPVTTTAFLNAKQSTTVGIQFLVWLAAHGRDLHTASQQDIDAWFAAGPSTRKHATRLISWAKDQRILRGVQIPPRPTGNGEVMGPQERLGHLRRVLQEDQLHIVQRVIAVLVLLFGQPLSKIVRLRRNAVTIDGDQVKLTLGDEALLLPPPVAELMTTFIDDPRFRRNTAANHDSPWLFPGTQPGRPLHVYSAHGMLKTAGIPARAARAGTWLDLVRTAPPSILADALGIHANTAMRYAKAAGADFLTYAGLAEEAVRSHPRRDDRRPASRERV